MVAAAALVPQDLLTERERRDSHSSCRQNTSWVLLTGAEFGLKLNHLEALGKINACVLPWSDLSANVSVVQL